MGKKYILALCFLFAAGFGCRSFVSTSQEPEGFYYYAAREEILEFSLPEPLPLGPEFSPVYKGGREEERGLPLPEFELRPLPRKIPAVKTTPPPYRTVKQVEKTSVPTKTPSREEALSSVREEVSPEKLFSAPGKDILVSLVEEGWIFTELTGPGGGLELDKRETRPGQTLFFFKALDEGEYGLTFYLQDHSLGVERQKKILVDVVDKETFVQILEPTPGPRMVEKGSGDWEENEELARIYETDGDWKLARKMWEQNLDAREPYRKRALEGVVRNSVKERDLEEVLSRAGEIMTLGEEYDQEDLRSLIGFLEENNKLAMAIRIINSYLDDYLPYEFKGELYYLLGKLYGKDSPLRDLKKSRFYLEKVYTDFAESPYAGKAREGVQYLDRHFLYMW